MRVPTPGQWIGVRPQPVFVRIAAFVFVGGLFLSATTAARALSPESPEVKQVIAKGMKFLETANFGSWELHPGMKSLIGMCVLKQYGEQGKNHPKVAEAIATIRSGIKGEGKLRGQEEIYDIGISLIFLLDLEIEKAGDFTTEMQALLEILLSAQKPHGGFGYPGRTTGDTSMTQYGALGMWACQIAGLEVPLDNWERLFNWLLRTQDPSGGYGYQGTDPGSMNLVKQPDGIRQSMTAAALGSIAICAESLRLFAAEKTAPSGPSKLTRVAKPEEARTKNVDPKLVAEALRRGQGWFAAHYTSDYKVDGAPAGSMWSCYYMYAFERYKSFLALLPMHEKDDNKWYDDGYAHLAKTQAENGSWEANDLTGPNTALALLFLFRSTQKIIINAKTFGGGLLVGGRGLPKDGSSLELVGGSLRSKALKGPAMELLQKLADPNDPKFEEAVRGMEEQSLVDEGDRLTEVQKRLRAMAAGKSPEARAAALKLLGRTRNLDDVPLLIEALHDEDPLVVVAATEALQFMARKFRPAGEFGVDADARKQAVAYWKAWYLDIRPDAVFNDG
jgi:hypothetical protein